MNLSPNSGRHRQGLRGRIKEAVRETILKAGEAVFTRDGVQGARMEEIAGQAGVSVGTLYNYFGDRQALLDALLDEHRVDLGDQLDRALEGAAGAPFHGRLSAFLEGILEYARDHWDFISLLTDPAGGNGKRGGHPHRKATTIEEVYRRAEVLTRGGVEDGVLRREGAELFPALLVGTVRGVILRSIFEHQGPPTRESARRLVEFFLDGAGNR